MSVHLVISMHVHCQLDDIDPTAPPKGEEDLLRLREISEEYETLLEQYVPEGVEVMAACVTSIQSAEDPDEADNEDLLERLKCALVDVLRSQAL